MQQNLLKDSAIHLLHRANQCVSDIFVNQMQGESLTPRQFAVLSAVSKEQGLNQTNLVKVTGIDRSTLADIIQRMLKKGLITRKRTENDGRAYSVFLTPIGQQMLDEALPNVLTADQQVLEALPEESREVFLNSLHKIIEISEKVKKQK